MRIISKGISWHNILAARYFSTPRIDFETKVESGGIRIIYA
jgi:hypothetical protein